MSQHIKSDSIELVAFQMISNLNLRDVLTFIIDGLVDVLDASFARIWLLHSGDLCAECNKAYECTNRQFCLHLFKSSAGACTIFDGEYAHVPIGATVIGHIAKTKSPMFTNDTVGDERLLYEDRKFLKENGFCSFAGYPLVFRGELLGVVAMFNQRVMSPDEFDHLVFLANQATVAIKNAQLFAEVEQLKNRLQEENIYLQKEITIDHTFEDIIGKSRVFRHVLHEVEQVARTNATVLILGETGTGKELLARAIHHLSPRKDRLLVKVNCAALPPTLIESELFGHEKGAFTGAHSRRVGRFELADGGTVFLDEIGDLSLELQTKLLRVLQEREFERVGAQQTTKVDTRVIAATNRDLEEATKTDAFREDLYYRLNVFPIRTPPLRDRKEDIPLLVKHFTKKYSVRHGKNVISIPQKTMKAFQNYSWPGNVRELENIIERAVILSQDTTLHIDEFFDWRAKKGSKPPDSMLLRDVERAHILRVLEHSSWIIEGDHGAAVSLGLNPGTLRYRMKKLGIRRPR